MALMKLIATPEELRKLSMNHIESENNTKVQNKVIFEIIDKDESNEGI
jgi:hypothetical protein